MHKVQLLLHPNQMVMVMYVLKSMVAWVISFFFLYPDRLRRANGNMMMRDHEIRKNGASCM